ncbi:WbqC family protein [Capnocytophaga sp.]|uniref:WbqC family protein n=1 Tax=Capnocytophaga sp. TaxID=44737 RepID=UPI0026DC7DC1|nr:WbqC family protein [Capnocytophaga sp.]MDO5104749.1 WbqC family protein [Capnocytophaga sp.]
MYQALIHPTYFPSIAQFHLMLTRPCVLEVSDNYQKQTLRNRAYIYGANGKQALNLPIKHVGGETGRQLFKDVRVENHFPWQRLHWKSLETAYRTSPFFEFYEDEFRPLFEKQYTFLLDVNLDTIALVMACLQTDVNFEKTKTYEAEPKYAQDFRQLTSAKKPLPVKTEEYYQIFADKHGFLSNLSVIDLLFHEGGNTLDFLMKNVQIITE